MSAITSKHTQRIDRGRVAAQHDQADQKLCRQHDQASHARARERRERLASGSGRLSPFWVSAQQGKNEGWRDELPMVSWILFANALPGSAACSNAAPISHSERHARRPTRSRPAPWRSGDSGRRDATHRFGDRRQLRGRTSAQHKHSKHLSARILRNWSSSYRTPRPLSARCQREPMNNSALSPLSAAMPGPPACGLGSIADGSRATG